VETWAKIATEAVEALDKIRWIPVTEKWPEKDGLFLVFGKWGSGKQMIDTCEYSNHDGYFRTAWNFDVTHWMPLPEPPKEKEE
jgi:hypothetical protein